MNKNLKWVGAVIVVVVIGLLFYGSYTQTMKQAKQDDQGVINTATTTNDNLYSDITTITAKHYFIDGKHTLVGEIILPTACDLLDNDFLIRETYPEQVMIDFTVINTAGDCEPALTPQRFMIEVVASAEAQFQADFMGRRVNLNLIPAPAGETPDQFELFIKG